MSSDCKGAWMAKTACGRCESCRTEAERLIPAILSREGALLREIAELGAPVPMILTCPSCGIRHHDEGEFATRPHHTHACQGCGMVWRPAVVHTVGVRFLPGYKNP